jgi:hypothetical protein
MCVKFYDLAVVLLCLFDIWICHYGILIIVYVHVIMCIKIYDLWCFLCGFVIVLMLTVCAMFYVKMWCGMAVNIFAMLWYVL